MATQAPYGDIFAIGSPYVDRATDRLYLEQRRRDDIRRQQQRQLDDEFSKNLSAVKDADIPDIAKAYGDWKTSHQTLMRKGVISPEEQLDDLRKRAEVYRQINESKAQRQRDENDRKLLGTHPENLVDEANDVLLQRYRTPTSKLSVVTFKNQAGQDVPLSDYNILYNGGNYNAAEDILKSRGQLITNDVPEGDNVKTYQFYSNDPTRVKDYFLGAQGKREANKYYRNQLMNLPPDELVKAKAAYDAIPESQFSQMGQKKPKLDFDNLSNYADTYATYQAMKSAVENVPRLTKTALSDEAKMRKQAEKEKAVISFREGLANSYRKGLIDYKKAGTQEEQNGIVERLLDDSIAAGVNDYAYLNGKLVPATKIRTIQGVGKLHERDNPKLTGVKDVPTFYITRDKKYVIPRYPGESSKDQEPIPIKTFMTEMGQVLLTKKENQGEVGDILDDEGDNTGSSSAVPYSGTKTTSPKKKEIKASDIAAKAAAAHYTEQEYRALLKKNGVKIVP